jgi:ABC-2 type transport system permease protein
MMMLVPVLTMRLLAEERRNQTMPLLMAAPVSSIQIVLGKFIGLMLFLLLPIVASTLMALVLALGTPLDIGLLLSNAAGLLLITACYAALGLYISALTVQPIVAAIGALAALAGLWLVESSAGAGNFWHALAPSGHFQHFNTGLLDSSDLVYYLLFCGFFLLLAMRRIHNNRLYG